MTKKITTPEQYEQRKARQQRRKADPVGAIADPILTTVFIGLVALLVISFIVGLISAAFGG